MKRKKAAHGIPMIPSVVVPANQRQNSNILHNVWCPRCGSEGPFHMWVIVKAHGLVTDDGWDINDLEMDSQRVMSDRQAKCAVCGYTGPYPDFDFRYLKDDYQPPVVVEKETLSITDMFTGD